jgi:hypothetical protein
MSDDRSPDPLAPVDRRLKPRKRVLLSGAVVYGDGKFSFQCKIRDVTADDARIVIPAGQPLPSEIYLINMHDQTAHKANVMWLRNIDAGLRFVSTFTLPIANDPSLEFLNRIWRAKLTSVTNIREE